MLPFHSIRRRKLWKSGLAGACAGLAGTIAMTQFQSGWDKVSRQISHKNGSEQQAGSTESQKSDEDSENATMKAAGKLASLAGRELSFKEKKKAGAVVHYGFGTVMGMAYGAAAELSPRRLKRHPALSGSIFGATLFAVADELAVPKLGLSSGQAPTSSHLYALASHLVYGVTAGFVHSVMRGKL